MWERELEVAKEASIRAGEAIMKIYADKNMWSVEYKNDRSPLTAADRAANDVIVSMLKDAFPKYAILSEEEKDDRKRLFNEYCFVVDPLDGTKEFLKRNGQFTVNIALSYQHRTVMGVIYVPVEKELYYAAQGGGAYLETSAGSVQRLHVSNNVNHSQLRAVISSSHGCEEMEKLIQAYHITNLLRIGSSLKGCLVAKGEVDIYFRYNPTMEWDTAAMQCIVENAGGIFKQMDDTDMMYNRENSLNEKGFYAINRPENRLYEGGCDEERI